MKVLMLNSGGAAGNFVVDDATYPSITTVDLFMIAWDVANALN